MDVKKIYIDMDGVLADFDGWKATQPGINDDNLWEYAKRDPHFYLNLKPLPEYALLLKYLEGLEVPLAILTALPRRDTLPFAAQDKKQWVKNYVGDYEFLIGPYAVDKQKRSGPGMILIDDSEMNCSQWEARGGKAFLYKGFLPFFDQFERFRNRH